MRKPLFITAVVSLILSLVCGILGFGRVAGPWAHYFEVGFFICVTVYLLSAIATAAITWNDPRIY